MKKEIELLSWQEEMISRLGIDVLSIENDFILFDRIRILPEFSYPFRLDITTLMICTAGTTRGKIGLKSYETVAPCLVTLPAGEILQYEEVSDDFEGLFIVMSKRFTNSILPDSHEHVAIASSIRENPCISLNSEDLDLLKNYYNMLKRMLVRTENPHRNELVRLLMKAFHYFSTSLLQELPPKPKRSKGEEYAGRFLELAQKHYKTERKINFYAGKLYRTPKYISQVVKASTGKPANRWIDDFVMLEAKALLKSTRMTIQQISDELHFGDQSLFGKYFKRQEGVSPKEYRGMTAIG